MISPPHFLLVLLLSLSLSAPMAFAKELLDRVAITVGLEVITEQEIYEQVRIAAFLDGKEPEYTQQTLRETADRMVTQRLLMLDMRSNGFPMPSEEELEAALSSTHQEFWSSQEAFERAAQDAKLDPLSIRLFLRSAVATMKYIDFRFRPAVRVSDSAVLERYMERYPQTADPNDPEPPPFESVRDSIEASLVEEVVDNNIERWLEDARARAEVRYLPEVLP